MSTITGTNQDDTIDGTTSADVIIGGNGSDTLSGGDGSDTLLGGNGQDTLSGGTGDDLLSGGNGIDMLDGGAGSDAVYGNNGDDVATYVVVENFGAVNFYDGGNGSDTLVLSLTQAQFDEMSATSVFSDFAAVAGTGALFDFSTYGFNFDINLTATRFEQIQTVIVADPNLPPDAVADSNSINEDRVPNAVSGNVLANDTDPNTPALNLSVANAGVLIGNYGTLTLNADGSYSYVLDNANATVDALNVGDTLQDVFSYTVTDGALDDTADLTITIAGANDAAIITGDISGTVDEDAVSNTATGDLNAADVDSTADAFQAVAAGAASANGYGTYAVTAAGVWTYTLDNTHAAVNALNALETLTDSFTVLSADGTAQVVTVTINGNTDPALFTAGNDTVNFNNVVAGTYQEGTQYNALGGNDLVFLPTNAAEAAEAGYVVGTAFIAGDGSNNIIGGSLDDTIFGGTGFDRMEGRDGNDTLLGGAGNDQLIPGLGDDFIDGGAGADDAMTYNLGPVTVNLSTGTASGAEGNDTIVSVERVTGSNFADIIIGNDANNTLTGRDGNDTIDGGLGNDVIFGGLGDDALDGGGGADRVSYQSATGGVTVDMSSGTATGADGNDTLMNIEQVFGSAFNDLFVGSTGNDQFFGLAGNDRLVGGAGNDSLGGDAPELSSPTTGNDILEGGIGNDQLAGGAGNDTFVFQAGWDLDTIVDFQDGTDVIDLRTMGFTDVSQLSISQVGAHTEIDFGGGDLLRLNNFNAGLLGNSDFLFV